MFKETDKGRIIRIKNTNGAGWIKKGKKYTILEFTDSKNVRLDDKNKQFWCGREGDYEFTDELLKIGDQIVVDEPTQSLKKDEIKFIVGFLNEDKEKIIVEGLLPGGWIPMSKISKLININEYRLATLYELIHEFGFGLQLQLNISDTQMKLIEFGKPVKDLKIERRGKDIIYTSIGMKVPEMILRDVNEPISDFDIYIIDQKTMENLVSKDNKLYIAFSPYCEKSLSSIYEISTHEDLTNTIKHICKLNSLVTKVGRLPMQFITLKKLNEEAVNIPDPALPF